MNTAASSGLFGLFGEYDSTADTVRYIGAVNSAPQTQRKYEGVLPLENTWLFPTAAPQFHRQCNLHGSI